MALTIAGRELFPRALRGWSKLRPIRFAFVGRSPLAEQLARGLETSVYPHVLVGAFGGSGEGGPAARAVRLAPAEPASAVSGADPAESFQLADLGPAASIRERSPSLDLDLLILAGPDAAPALVEDIFAQCQELDLDFLFVPDLQSFWGRRMRVEEIGGLPVIRLRDLSWSAGTAWPRGPWIWSFPPRS